jgi:hypothetical protein
MSQSDRPAAAGAAVLFDGLAIAICLFVAGMIFGRFLLDDRIYVLEAG